jgi:ATPase subunit of ABC transporter with duplicated ATPase domains
LASSVRASVSASPEAAAKPLSSEASPAKAVRCWSSVPKTVPRPTRRAGRGTVFGTLDQRRTTFAEDASLLAGFLAVSALPEVDARTLLAKFALGADDLARPAASLSPGERTRAVLALLQARGVNCLVLDEPTNHLDLEAIEQLEGALAGYDGTLVVVSHDRRFLEGLDTTRRIEL